MLERTKLEEMYSSFLPEGNCKIFVDQMFRILDKDGDGSIDFKVSTGAAICDSKCPEFF